MNNPVASLASLSATYTDSENEDDNSDEEIDILQKLKSNQNIFGTETSAHTTPESASGSVARPAILVPYNLNETVPEITLENNDVTTELATSYGNDSDWENEGDDKKGPSDNEDNFTDFLNETDGILLPPEPKGHCSKLLQEKIMKLFEKRIRENVDMNKIIQNKKAFRNPSIYEKLIQFCDIDELGTNFSPEVSDPHCWGVESFYDHLAKVQKEEMDKREKEKKDRTKVEFVSGTIKKSVEDISKRKSKWDQINSGNGKPAFSAVGLIPTENLAKKVK